MKGIPHMNLTDINQTELDAPELTVADQIIRRCGLAAQFVESGQYELAQETLGECWPGIGKRPLISKLNSQTAAELMLQCGVLSGWLGRVRHLPDIQEKAKDLIFEAMRIYESDKNWLKVSEANYELGMCYFRLGAYDEARDILDEALKHLGDTHVDLRAKILIRHTLIEVWTGRYHDALTILEDTTEFFEACNDAVKGRWHGQKGLVLQRLALTENRPALADRAIIEFTAAIYHYEQANHERYCGSNLNNLAMLLYQLGRYSQAHENLDRAVGIFERLRDSGNLASVNETRARVLVAEHRYEEANRIIDDVVRTFEKGNEYAMLTDALTIQGVVHARLNRHESSLVELRQAISIGHTAGALSNAGRAALTLIEEHGNERLSPTELYDIYGRADELLKDTQDLEEISRLRACARIMSRRTLGSRPSDKGFKLPKVVQEYESRFIREALEAEQGVVSRAAKRLGIGHQSFIYALKTRHKELLRLRTPAQPRMKSIIRRK